MAWVLQEIFFSLLKKQGIDSSAGRNIFNTLNVNVGLRENHRDEVKRILSSFNVLAGIDDVLGHIYQSIQSQEDRKDSGQYYTPNKVVDFIIENIEIQLSKNKDLKILDPACGSGQFLMRAYNKLFTEYKKIGVNDNTAHKNIVEKHLFGIDIDPIACVLTKANLVLKNPFVAVETNIFTNNFLKKDYHFETLREPEISKKILSSTTSKSSSKAARKSTSTICNCLPSVSRKSRMLLRSRAICSVYLPWSKCWPKIFPISKSVLREFFWGRCKFCGEQNPS